MSKTFLSVIIPVKNEAHHLSLVLSDIDRRLSENPYASEIVVASYGRGEETVAVVKKMAAVLKNLKLVVNQEEDGLGSSLRQGMLLASGEIRLLTSIKNLVKVSEFNQMLPHFKNGADIVLGVRKEKETSFNSIFSNPKYLTAKLANFTLKNSLLKGLSDPISDFRAFSASAAEKIFSANNIDSHFFSVQSLIFAKKNGLKIEEAAVSVSLPIVDKRRIILET